jgi:hypothetical protein
MCGQSVRGICIIKIAGGPYFVTNASLLYLSYAWIYGYLFQLPRDQFMYLELDQLQYFVRFIGPAAIVLHTVLNTYTLVIKVLYFPTARLGFQMAAPIGRLELRAGRSRPPTTSQNLCIVLSGL